MTNASSPPVVCEYLPAMSRNRPRQIVAENGALSPDSVSAAEVLSRFRSSGSLRFLENGDKTDAEEIGMVTLNACIRKILCINRSCIYEEDA